MKLKCDGENSCGKEFDLLGAKLKTENIENDLEKTYFTCPYCGKEYVVCYTDERIRNKQKAAREVKGMPELREFMEEIDSDIQKLRERMESI